MSIIASFLSEVPESWMGEIGASGFCEGSEGEMKAGVPICEGLDKGMPRVIGAAGISSNERVGDGATNSTGIPLIDGIGKGLLISEVATWT